MKQSKLLLLSLCILFSHPVFALRCGYTLVDIGNYKEEVIDKCGEPQSIESHIERRGVSNVVGQSQYYGNGTILYTEIEVVVEEWIYDFGRRKFKQYMRFENGRLTEIKDLGYAH
jgi:hypothetical protein